MLSAVVGWWGIPWGIIYTLEALATNWSGGKNVTAEVEQQLFRPAADPLGEVLTAGLAQAASRRGVAVGRVKCANCGLEVWEKAGACWKCGAPLPPTSA